MNAARYRRLAVQCEEMLLHAGTELVREQLRVWVAEFRERAAEADFAEQHEPVVAALDRG